jgi:hypothetical protein
LSATSNELDHDFFRFQNQLLLLTEVKQFGKHNFFFHAADLALTESKKQVKTLSLNLKMNESVVKSGHVLDPNAAHILFYALVEDIQNRVFRMHFSIFDKNLMEQETGSKTLIFPSENMLLQNVHLSNDNHVLAVFKLYAHRASRFHLSYRDLDAFFLVDFRKNENHTVKVEIPEKKIADLVVYPQNNQIWRLTGLWSDQNKGQTGFFSSLFNSESNAYFDEHEWVHTMPTQITSTVGNSVYKLNEGQIVNTNSPLTLFLVRDFFPTDQGFIAVFEESFVGGRYTEQLHRGVDDNLVYNNNNIVVIHFNAMGKMLWTREISKTMKETTNRNATASFMLVKNPYRLTFFFNDNLNNYNESGSYIEKNHFASTKKRENAVAQVTVDVNLGTSTRHMLTIFKDSQGFFLPTKSTTSANQSHVHLAFQQSLSNQMYRFGTMRLD